MAASHERLVARHFVTEWRDGCVFRTQPAGEVWVDIHAQAPRGEVWSPPATTDAAAMFRRNR